MTNPEIDKFGNKIWLNDKRQLHREDGPAVEWIHGTKHWAQNGKRHRVDGPAVIYRGSDEVWYVNDKHIDIKPILERLDISPDWRNWTEEEKFLVRLALS